jgi:hypothetical protein
MHLLQTMGKRLWDAVRVFVAVLFGTLTPRTLTPTARVRHAAALQADLLEVASLLEKMHAWTSRMAARDSRAAKKLLDEGGDEHGEPVGAAQALAGATGAPLSTSDRKQMLRRYVTAQRFGFEAPAPPPVASSPEAEPQIPLFAGDGDDNLDNGDEP